ncbi:glycosylhydrolase-like jelly roll fold domain-containing protein [Qaidamihabitans albus]|uniref:glycosylhydrolase-like jelly roll fold domain-containing protein n=1 Tax=Qaidamihabitans albus TaxID=2795733 RepID=UPI0018F1146D|nr:glycosyl hydrolase [Qaidamihabitans albus]
MPLPLTRSNARARKAAAGRVVLVVLLLGGLAGGVQPAGAAAGETETTPVTTSADSPGESKLDAERFASPPSSSRPTLLWFWNGKMTPELIDRQLAAMRDEGFHEAVIFPRGDDRELEPQFFSEAWFDIIGHTLDEARRHDMHLWLFNDDYFPSGRAASLVLRGGRVGDRVYEPQPQLRPQELTRLTSKEVAGPGPIDLSLNAAIGVPGFRVQDGVLRVDAGAAAGGGEARLTEGHEWRDYAVEYDLTIRRGAGGFVVRSTGDENGYLIDHGRGGVVNIYRKQGTGLTKIGTGQATGIDPAAERRVRIRVAGSTVEASVNGDVVATADDDTWSAGTAGPRVVADQAADFDDMRITSGAGTVLYEETFDDAAAVDAFDTTRFSGGGVQPEDVVAVSALPIRDGTPDLGGVVDLTERFRKGEQWDAPEGRFQLEYYRRHHLSMTGLYNNYLDLMNPEAVTRYLDVIHGEYYRRFPEAFGTVLRGFWDDEPANPREWGRTAWSDVLPGELAEEGKKPAQVLPALFGDHGRAGRIAKGAYEHAVSDGLANYYRLSGKWAKEHDVALMSNPYSDHFGPTSALRWGDTYKNDQWFQVPGADAVFNQVLPGKQSVIPRYPASSGHQMGRERIGAEVLGAYGWGVTPELTRFVNGYMAVRGVNFSIFHAYWADPSKVIHPPPFQPENSWWSAVDGATTWTGRVMEAALGRAVAPTAVIHPQRASEAWAGTPAAGPIDSGFERAVTALEDVQVDLDTLPDSNLDGDAEMRRQAVPREGALHIGPQAYRFVVLPPSPTFSLESAQRLSELVREGGTVVAMGELPTEETSGKDAELRKVLTDLFGIDPASPEPHTEPTGAGKTVFVADAAALQRAADEADVAAAELAPADSDVRVLRTKRGGQQVFLVMNEGEERVDTAATFPASGTPRLWDPEDGSSEQALHYNVARGGRAVTVSLRLEPHEVQAVSFEGASGEARSDPHLLHSTAEPRALRQVDASTLEAEVEIPDSGDHPILGAAGGRYYRGVAHVDDELAPIPLEGDWRFRFDRADAEWTDREPGSWTDLDPHYSGSAVYQKEFELSAADVAEGNKLRLHLGAVRDVAEVTVNGTKMGRLLWKPYRVDVTDALRAGTNRITVRVTNTNANEHGSAQPSGLLGPVALTPYRVQTVRLTHAPDGVAVGDTVAMTAAPATASLAGCQPHRVNVAIHNFGPRPISGPLELEGSDGIAANGSTTHVEVDGRDAVTIPVDVHREPGSTVSSGTLTAGFQGQSVSVRLAVGDNLVRGAQVSASSTHNSHSAPSVVNGTTDSTNWGVGDGWNDNTIHAFPDWVTARMACEQQVGRVDVYTLDSARFPASRFGIKDFDVQVRDGDAWRTVAEVRDNTQGLISTTFTPVTTDAVRLVVHSANDGDYARVMEIEAYRE